MSKTVYKRVSAMLDAQIDALLAQRNAFAKWAGEDERAPDTGTATPDIKSTAPDTSAAPPPVNTAPPAIPPTTAPPPGPPAMPQTPTDPVAADRTALTTALLEVGRRWGLDFAKQLQDYYAVADVQTAPVENIRTMLAYVKTEVLKQ